MATESLSARILRENDAVLGAMLSHRFVEDVQNDRLTKAAFERYLVFEGAFVDSAISIFAYAAATAKTMAQKRWLIAVLDTLANEQIAYFERTFASRGIDPSSFDTGIPRVEAFRAGMLEIARRGGFLDIVAAMFAAEWMYWTWSKEAASRPISDPLLKEWVDLHVEPGFAAQAQWLKNELDVAGEMLEEDEKARLSAIFGQALHLEIDFHDAPYL
ncbi:putative transcription activator [Rhizobium leguminosarum bv. trifolii WSM2297]|uniref:Aminopyrimidine aminohydrolase n=1 Tax=Rhizobium leguminosarum bv. trifolii WSM2297 TaxID=754762 RepID=J0L142_RHILT|nr:TenA family protein [Rhizobium leguminosarum]EJC83889.1 putative transcription activator [Rhizobium leguminosarum bv. trifolii WSM2297]EJC84520.1 putative transcription activator [Rhizobium leguminosarum bv. trifolii WSM2297]